jgi:hypothetical protein
VRTLAVVVSTLADGLFVRRAILPSFDPGAEVGAVMAVIAAAFAGRIDLSKPTEKATEKADTADQDSSKSN